MRARHFLVLLALALLPLAACGDRKAEQASAFAELLQRRILDTPGVHIPTLSDEERDKIGPYAQDLAILKAFDDDLSDSMREFAQSMHPAPPNVRPLDLPKYKPDLLKARAFFPRAVTAIDSALTKAEGARAKLAQPPEVKVKFDAAFDRLVAQPARAVREIAPNAVAALEAEIDVADFIETHRAELQDVGGRIGATKPALLTQLEALFGAYQEKYAKIPDGRRELEKVVLGR